MNKTETTSLPTWSLPFSTRNRYYTDDDTKSPVVIRALQRRWPRAGWACSGNVCVVREGFPEEMTWKLRTKGLVGVHHGRASGETHADGCSQTIAVGHRKGRV